MRLVRLHLAALIGFVAAASALPALATCHGRDLLAATTPAQRAALVRGVPFARGNLWRATRGRTEITLIGTYHLDDPRTAALAARLAPIVRKADTLLVEAGPKQQARLKRAMTQQPQLMFITKGPTLPDRLSPADWAALQKAMKARGIPVILAAKFRPWYAAMMLGIPACAVDTLRASRTAGLDQALIATATKARVPIAALEPWDTSVRIFQQMSRDESTGMIHAALAMQGDGADMFVTTANAYFAGEHQLLWAFDRARALKDAGPDRAAVLRDLDLVRKLLLVGRNRAWMPVLLNAAKGRSVVAAFGAAHLGGKEGVLNLLKQAGFTLRPLPG